jgi:hypothetical protein
MTQNLKNLLLDKSKIEGAVRSFHAEATITGPNAYDKFTEYEIHLTGEEAAKLHVYARNDDTFTLNSSVGRNQVLSRKVAEHVAENCKRKEYEQRPLAIEHISQADWNFLLKHLADDYGFTVIEGSVPHGVRFDVKKGQNDQVNLNRYHKKGNFLMQGKAREVYATVVDILSDHLPDKREIVEAQLKTYDVTDVKAAELFEELSQHIPSAMDLLGETGAAIIAPALALAKLNIDLPDYSCIAYPALRGQEVYIKAIMANRNHAVLNNVGFGNFLDGSGTRLKKSVRDSMTVEEANAVEECYAFHKQERHSLFHAEANPDMTRIIVDKTEAVSVLQNVLRLIERTAAAIPDHAR